MLHNYFWRYSSRMLPLMLVVVGAGCTSPTLPVEGVLVWDDDGKPVAGANLRFVPAASGKEAIGATDDKGAFTLVTGSQSGAEPGVYKVVVTKFAVTGNYKGEVPKSGDKAGEDMIKAMKGGGEQAMKGKPPTVKDPVPPIYASDQTTPLTCKIESGKKLELKIKRS